MREGDTWSAATIVKHEGRRYFIHYDGADASTDEWVTPDRIRVPGAAPAPSSGSTTKPAAPKTPTWNNGQKVAVKWGGLWRQASITNRRGEWYLVSYDARGNSREWVEPWRIRAVGSSEDNIGYAKPNMLMKVTDPPPTPQPGPPTEPIGARRGSRGGVTPDPVEAANIPDIPELKPIPVNRSGALTGAFSGAVGSAHIAPDAQAKPAKELTSRGIGLAAASPDVQRVFFSSPQVAVAAVCAGTPMKSPGKTTNVQRIDLVSGKSLGIYKFPTPIEGDDLSPDGKLLLARNNIARKQLDVWDISESAGDAKHVVSFVPFEDGDIKWMRFLDNDHLVAQENSGAIAMFEFRTPKLIWSGGAHAGVTPAISPNGRYIAIGAANIEIVIADARDGKPLGKLPADNGSQWVLSFKPDGKQLAGFGTESLFIWDLAGGKLTSQITVIGNPGRSIDWVDEGFVLLDNSYLTSLEKKLVVWTYEEIGWGFGTRRGAEFAGRYWYATESSRSSAVLVPIELPDPAARNATASVNADQEFVLHPGMKVSLDVRLSGDGRQKVYDALKKRLTDNGLIVADGQPMKIVAYTENGDEHEMQYHSFGIARGVAPTTHLKVRDVKNIVAIQSPDGKNIWQRQYVVTAPFGLTLKQGQTIEQAVAEHMVPNIGFFQSVNVPAYLPKSRTGLGTSKLTASGAQATPGH